MQATTTPATPKKLRDGSWGALATSEHIAAGDVVEITTRSGKSWLATVGRVLWAGDGKAICTTYSTTRGGRPADSGRECDECGRRGARHTAVDSSGLGGTVCGRCASLPAVERSFA